MRLTLITETYPPDINGVANTLGRWVSEFVRRGHDVSVLRPWHPRERWTMHEVPACPLPFYPEVRIGLPWPGQVRRFLQRHRPELVHIATEGLLGLAALLTTARMRIATVSSFHTHFDQYLGYYGMGWIRALGRSYLKWFHNRTRCTLAPSTATCRLLTNAGFQHVALWSRGIDVELFHPRRRSIHLRQTWGMHEDDCLILYVGRLAQEKNLHLLLQSFQQLQTANQAGQFRLKLVLVGDGPMKTWIERQSFPDVILAGVKRGQDLASCFASADVFAFPSRSETFGNVILEAQASGLPVLALHDPTMLERIRHDVDGWISPDEEAFPRMLWQLTQAPPLRQRLGYQARLRAQSQGWKPIFDQLEQLYLSIIHGQQERSRLPLLSTS